jgi:deoxyribonuclease-4
MSLRVGAAIGDEPDPIAWATRFGATCLQINLGDPTSWAKPSVAVPGGTAQLKEAAAAANLAIYVHAPYVINVASTNNRIRIPSRKLLQSTLDTAAEFDAAGVVVHAGHVTKDDDPAAGYENWHKAVTTVEMSAPLFIENAASGKYSMGRTPEAIKNLWQAVGESGIGFCVDTCHAWAAGIPLETLGETIRAITGRIDLVHANNSQDAFGSGRDRHANFLNGQIPVKVLLDAIAGCHANAVCETAEATMNEDIELIQTKLRGNG